MTNKKSIDLKQRIFTFVLRVVSLARRLSDNKINRIFVDQIVRSSSGIGSNYEEADGTPTKRDFIYKMGVVKKEAKETKYWLRMIRMTNDKVFWKEIDELGMENEELIKIFAKIIINSSS